MDVIGQSATALSQAIRARTISPVEVMRETLARIAKVNPESNAIVSMRDQEALMGEARLAEAMPPDGWLHGIPVAIKDMVEVKGVTSTSGAPHLRNHVPKADQGLAHRLRQAGAIIIGKTNVPMFAVGSHTTNPVFGPTLNPFDAARTAGGSSGGASVALATGMLAIADGSDAMGSLRNPAAWANVYGFRPTVGLVPDDPVNVGLIDRLSTNGPMARTVGDLEALLRTLSDGQYTAQDAPTPVRIGWLADWGGAYATEPGIMSQAETALTVMEGLGWQVTPLAPPVDRDVLWQSWTDLRAFSKAIGLGAMARDPMVREGLNAQVLYEIAQGIAMTGERIERALHLRGEWLAALDRVFSDYHALLLPSTQVWPFPVELEWPTEIAGVQMDTYHRWMEVMIPASLAGLPVVNLPAGFGASGLPAGVQMMGPPGADGRILAMAHLYETAIGPRDIVTP